MNYNIEGTNDSFKDSFLQNRYEALKKILVNKRNQFFILAMDKWIENAFNDDEEEIEYNDHEHNKNIDKIINQNYNINHERNEDYEEDIGDQTVKSKDSFLGHFYDKYLGSKDKIPCIKSLSPITNDRVTIDLDDYKDNKENRSYLSNNIHVDNKKSILDEKNDFNSDSLNEFFKKRENNPEKNNDDHLDFLDNNSNNSILNSNVSPSNDNDIKNQNKNSLQHFSFNQNHLQNLKNQNQQKSNITKLIENNTLESDKNTKFGEKVFMNDDYESLNQNYDNIIYNNLNNNNIKGVYNMNSSNKSDKFAENKCYLLKNKSSYELNDNDTNNKGNIVEYYKNISNQIVSNRSIDEANKINRFNNDINNNNLNTKLFRICSVIKDQLNIRLKYAFNKVYQCKFARKNTELHFSLLYLFTKVVILKNKFKNQNQNKQATNNNQKDSSYLKESENTEKDKRIKNLENNLTEKAMIISNKNDEIESLKELNEVLQSKLNLLEKKTNKLNIIQESICSKCNGTLEDSFYDTKQEFINNELIKSCGKAKIVSSNSNIVQNNVLKEKEIIIANLEEKNIDLSKKYQEIKLKYNLIEKELDEIKKEFKSLSNNIFAENNRKETQINNKEIFSKIKYDSNSLFFSREAILEIHCTFCKNESSFIGNDYKNDSRLDNTLNTVKGLISDEKINTIKPMNKSTNQQNKKGNLKSNLSSKLKNNKTDKSKLKSNQQVNISINHNVSNSNLIVNPVNPNNNNSIFFNNEFIVLNSENLKLKQEIKNVSDSNKKLEKDILSMVNKLKSKNEYCQTIKDENDQLKGLMCSLNYKSLADIEMSNQKLKEEIKIVKKDCDDVKEKLKSFKKENEDLKLAKIQFEDQLKQFEDLKEDKDNNLLSLRRKEIELSNLKQELDEIIKGEISKITRKSNLEKDEIKRESDYKINELKAHIDSLTIGLKKTNQELEIAYSNIQSYQVILKNLESKIHEKNLAMNLNLENNKSNDQLNYYNNTNVNRENKNNSEMKSEYNNTYYSNNRKNNDFELTNRSKNCKTGRSIDKQDNKKGGTSTTNNVIENHKNDKFNLKIKEKSKKS
jgi:hypothetical protein